jgi:hypothetical protein
VTRLRGLAALILFASSAISYFRYQRPVQLSATAQQYIVVDEAIWKHARPDLGDLRLYNGQNETPYSLVIECGSQLRQRRPVPLLQQSTVAGKTQFLINMSALAEYDHVHLDLATKNFVAHARVEGSDDPHSQHWASLGDSILYDLSKDNLGSNTMLRLPRATYEYLRITVDGPVKPDEVLNATSEIAEDQPAVWRDVSGAPRQEQNTANKDSVLTFDLAEHVPAERVIFTIDPAQPNFQRKIEIQDGSGGWIGSGEINRIHIVRAGQKIDSESQQVSFSANHYPKIKVIVHNGDDPPLELTGARLQQMERRLYFDGTTAAQLMLYYGDEKLESPVHDYAKLFVRDKAAVPVSLGAETANPAFTGRPDDRPWSDRHPVVLWIAIIGAVVILAAIALRSIRTAAA